MNGFPTTNRKAKFGTVAGGDGASGFNGAPAARAYYFVSTEASGIGVPSYMVISQWSTIRFWA